MASTPTPTQSEPPGKRQKIDFSKEVIVRVGKEDKRFVCHPSLLSANSPYIQAVMQKDPDKIIRLPDQNPTSFSIYLNWRYTGLLDLWDGEPSTETRKASDGKEYPVCGPRMENMLQCYILGVKLDDHQFCNALTDAQLDLRKTTGNVPGPCIINPAFASLPKSAELLELMTRQVAFELDTAEFDEDISQYDPEVLKEIARISVVERGMFLSSKTAWCKDKCYFHVHKDGEAKCK